MIISHNCKAYKKIWSELGPARFNGAYYYSQEIVQNIIPFVKTSRNWLTIDWPGKKPIDHAIAFVHNNINLHWYEDWKGKDVVLVCGLPETAKNVSKFASSIFVPLSVDVRYVQQFTTSKIKDVCYAGRPDKKTEVVPDDIPHLEGMPRERMLREMAKYHQVYAVGRTAIEAKILGCEILPYDPRFPDPSIWQVLDNREAAKILDKKLKEVECGG